MADKEDLEQNQTKKQLDKEFKETVGGSGEDSQTTGEEDSKKTKEEEEEKSEPSSEKSKETEEPSEEDEGEGVESPKRPKKYIPIPKYQDEKKKWQEKTDKLTGKIEDLEKKIEKKEEAGIESGEDIKEFAEKHDMKEETVKELVGIVSKRNKIPSDVKEDIEKVKEEREEKEDQNRFEDEFEGDVKPLIYQEFPDAPKGAVDKVKKDLDRLAHTRRLHQTPLEFIFARNRGKYKEMLNPPNKKTAESGTTGRKGEQLTYEDVYNLPAKKRNKVIESMNEEEYEGFMKWSRKKEGTGATIHREGKEIEQL